MRLKQLNPASLSKTRWLSHNSSKKTRGLASRASLLALSRYSLTVQQQPDVYLTGRRDSVFARPVTAHNHGQDGEDESRAEGPGRGRLAITV